MDPLDHSVGVAEVRDCAGTGDSTGVDDRVFREKSYFADVVAGYRCIRRKLIVEEERLLTDGFDEDVFIADKRPDGDDADGCGEGEAGDERWTIDSERER